jgi:hypothetical protein
MVSLEIELGSYTTGLRRSYGTKDVGALVFAIAKAVIVEVRQ